VTWPELAEKFRRCAAFASRPPAEADIEQAIDVAQDLDTAPDVTVLSRLLG
jgi:hypothetical protein